MGRYQSCSAAAVLIALTATLCVVTADNLMVDHDKQSQPLHAIGGLSGGGATTRLLVDYVEPARTQILDYLFVPNFGASLQLLKVEIGGDSQSTDGTESSHMHSPDDLDYQRGYEWWLIQEAKKRNPDIKIYGLPWAFPGWVGEGSGSPFQYPNLTANYITKWVDGAKYTYGFDVDYIGVWNERSSDSTYVQTLRKFLDEAGYNNTKIVARDGGADICDDLAKDPDYNAAVDIIGLHYPSDYSNYSTCYNLSKPIWASEESSSYDDLNGAACWGRIITSHWALSKMTASIMWNLVGSYLHGTNWYASSMMTAVEPWSGHYEVNPVIWATAHVTQFTKASSLLDPATQQPTFHKELTLPPAPQIGWMYLEDGSGSGQLPQGGFYVTLVDPESNDFTINVVKIDEDHAPCTRPSLPSFNVSEETVTFQLAANMNAPETLAVWYSNFENYTDDAPIFERQADVAVGSDGTFQLHVPIGAMYTISTIKNGPQKGSHGTPPASQPAMPLPIKDSFNAYPESQEARWWSDQIGAFEVHPATDTKHTSSIMRQMVPELPIGWSDHGSNGPVTITGMREWQDLRVTISAWIPNNANDTAACVGTRLDQSWANGIAFCIYTSGNYTLSIGGPQQATGYPDNVVASGTVPGGVSAETWYTIALETVDTKASAWVNNNSVFSGVTVRNIDTGFAGFGSNLWKAVEFDDVLVEKVGNRWSPLPHCNADAGAVLALANCTVNAVVDDAQRFELLADWGLRHVASGLCAQASNATAGAQLVLAPCDPTNTLQQLKNDYTNIRNRVVPMTLQADTSLVLVGFANNTVTVAGNGDYAAWSFFPNTGELRNQYVANTAYGFPKCLTACP